MIEVYTLGGYNEIGKNCTAIKIDDEVVIFDMGIHLENYIRFTEDEDIKKIAVKELVRERAIPDLNPIIELKKKVKAIIPTHAHLDHIGAIPFLARQFDAPVIATPFTCNVINTILRDERISIPNEIKPINVNSTYQISENLSVEFINMTHSTPQTVMSVLHTPYGSIVYANDFKIDNFPTLGQKPNLKGLEKIKQTKLLIIESLYADTDGKTPSEEVAKTMLKDLFMTTDIKNKAIVVTTFSSHIARLKSIIAMAKKIDRKVIFLGRSLSKYVEAARDAGIIDFDVEIVKYGKEIKARAKKLSREKKDYVIVCTGHQGEKQAVLNKIARDEIKLEIEKDDIVVFSCTVIPTKLNQMSREELEKQLELKGVRIFKDIHVSGHGSRDDLRHIIKLLQPEHIIPAHSDLKRETELAELASKIGYEIGKDVHIMQNAQKKSI